MDLPFIKKKNKDSKETRKKGPAEVVAVDFATTGLKLVRAKQSKDGMLIVAADIIKPLALDELAERAEHNERLTLPKEFTTYYAALTMTAQNAVVRHLTLTAQSDEGDMMDRQIEDHLGLEGDYRLGYQLTSQPQKKSEARVLAAALTEEEASCVTKLVASGSPAPVSLEIAGLSAINSFTGSFPEHAEEGAVAFIESGARVTYLVLFNRKGASLVRKFDFGAESIIQKVKQHMNVDHDVAEGIVLDGSIDISQAAQDVVEPFLRQLTISKDFVERRENCHIGQIYVSGGMGMLRYWKEELAKSTGLEVLTWDPFSGLQVATDAIPSTVVGQEARFSAAVGAARGIFEAA